MKKIIIILLFSLSISFAQKHNAGIYFDYQHLFIYDNMQLSDVSGDVNSNLCDCLNDLSLTWGFQAGIDYSYKINNYIDVGARAGFAFNNSEISSSEQTYPTEVIVRDPETNEIIDRYMYYVLTEQRTSLDFNLITFEPYARFNFGELSIMISPSLYTLMSSSFKADYRIVEGDEQAKFAKENLPKGAVLSDNGREIIFYDGEIPNKNTILPGILIGVSTNLYYQDFIFSPEMQFRYNFSHLSKDDFWLVHHFNLGIKISYDFSIQN